MSYAGYEAARLAVGQKTLCAALFSDQEDPECDACAILRAAAFPVLALQAVHNLSPVFFWDNCTIMHVVTDLALLASIETLHHPIALNGIGAASVSLTHKGQLPFLPPGVADGYYSPQAQSNILRQGYTHSHGATYRKKRVTTIS